MEEFDAVLGDAPHQVDRQRDEVEVSAEQLLDVPATEGEITEAGLRSNVNVGIQYISSWLRGNGAAAIYGMMEDAATAEIARGQVWQWVRHGAKLDDGRTITARARARAGDVRAGEDPRARSATTSGSRARAARTSRGRSSRQVALAEEFVEFLTLPAQRAAGGELRPVAARSPRASRLRDIVRGVKKAPPRPRAVRRPRSRRDRARRRRVSEHDGHHPPLSRPIDAIVVRAGGGDVELVPGRGRSVRCARRATTCSSSRRSSATCATGS